MRYFFRGALALGLSSCLSALPVLASPPTVFGFVIQTQGARLDGIQLPPTSGTTLFTGQILQTDAHGFVRLQVATNQLQLSELSEARLEGDTKDATLVLTHGAAAFGSPSGGGVAIRALDVLVRPKSPVRTVAQVELVGPDQFFVSCNVAPVELEMDGKLYSLAPGHTYVVRIQEQNPQPMDAGHHPAKSRRGLVIFIAGAAAAGVGALILRHQVTESPFKP